MNNKRITGLTNVPAYDGEVVNKKYVDVKLNDKANKNDLNGYLKLDGTSQMQGNLEMNNNRITRLPLPNLGDEAATKNYVTITTNHLSNLVLDRQGKSKMLRNIQMNDRRITGLTNPPSSDDEAVNKKYVDENISKSIKPSHTPKNVFQYLMDDVNEWSTEYGEKVGVINDLAESPHSWDKKVLNITPVKNGRNYRFRVGLQMYRMKTNGQYSLVVELYNRDYVTCIWERQQTYVNGTRMWVESNNTTKYQYHYGNNNTLYFSKTLIRFKKASSSPPVFVYFTIHYDDKSGDLNTYPKEFKNQSYLVAYGVEGLTDHVDSEVYDSHEAFEIDKTKMKMLVPLDMNGKKILNTNVDLKFGDIFKLIECHVSPPLQQKLHGILAKKSDFQPISFSVPVVLHSIIISNTLIRQFNKGFIEITGRVSNNIIRINLNDNLTMFYIFDNGINHFHFYNTGDRQFNADIVISYI